LPNYNIYATRDGWLAVAALEPHFWARLKSLLEVSEDSHEQMKAIFLTRTAEQWESWAQENRLPLAAVRGVSPER
jgi:alpha-methylacyl-CoA racemase